MNPNDPHDLNDPSDAALDRLLAQARWEEPTAADEYRLRETWQGIRRRRLVPTLYLAAAASVLFAVGVAFWAHQSTVEMAEHVGSTDVKYLSIQPEPVAPEPVISSRPATMYETLLVMSPRQAGPAPSVSNSTRSQINPAHQRLIDQLNDPLVSRRFDAARALSEVGDPQVVSILSGMVQSGINRREALAALMWSNDPSAAQALASARRVSGVEAQLLALQLEFGNDFGRRTPWRLFEMLRHFSV